MDMLPTSEKKKKNQVLTHLYTIVQKQFDIIVKEVEYFKSIVNDQERRFFFKF